MFYPVFNNKKDLVDYIFRATWYLKPLKDKLDKVVFITDFDITLDTIMNSKQPYLDSTIPHLLKTFKSIKAATSCILIRKTFIMVKAAR